MADLATTAVQCDAIDEKALRRQALLRFPPLFTWNKTVRQANLRAEYGISSIVIKRQSFVEGVKKETWNINPHPDDTVQKRMS